MRGPFTPQPGQSLQDQVNELGALVNRLREEVVREPQERERAIAAERQARQKELRALADRLEAVADDLRHEFEKLKETTTGGTRLRLEGVPLLLAGIVLTTWPGGIATALPSWPPLRVVVAFMGAYILARLTWQWWVPSHDGQPLLPTRPEVGCAVLWHGPRR
jgi:Flp pilus assembly protein TadB